MALEDVLGKIPGLAGYLGRQEFDQNQLFKQLQQTSGAVTLANALRDRQQAEQFRQEVAALGPGASPEDYGKVGLKYGKPADLIRGADEYQKIVDARKTREALQQGLDRIMGGSRAPTAAPSPIAPDVQETQQAADQGMLAPQSQTPMAAPTGVRDVSARLDQLKQLSMLYASNPAAVTAINREIDKLEAPSKDQPSVHVVQDKTSPTGWSYGDAKREGKILMRGAPPPANQELVMTDVSKKSAAAQVAAGQPLTQVVAGYGRNIGQARESVRQQAISQIMSETGKDEAGAGTELANRQIDFAAGKRSVSQLTTMLGATRQAVSQLDFNVNKVTEQMDKLGNKGNDLSPLINAIVRGQEKWTGDPAYSALYFYMHAAAMESARILQGGQASIAQLHQGAADEARKWASASMTTPKAWKEGVAPAMIAEGRARLKTYTDAISAARLGNNRGIPLTQDSPAQGGWKVTPVP